MNIVSKIVDFLLTILVMFLLLSSIGTMIMKKPFIISVIRSNSMYPLFQKGDVILVKNFNTTDKVEINDVIIYKTEKGSYSDKGWIVHRVIDIDKNNFYITKGDANMQNDQEIGGAMELTNKNIACKVVMVGEHVIKIPYIGYISIFTEKFNQKPYLILVLMIGMIVLASMGEFKRRKKRQVKKQSAFIVHMLMICAVVISLIFAATMLIQSKHYNATYIVDENQGALQGSDIGVIKKGEKVTKDLTTLENKGILPLIATITSNSKQLSSNVDNVVLYPKKKVDVSLTIDANTNGTYTTNIHVGLFFPFLPSKIIYLLAKKSFEGALIIVSIIPCLFIIFYILINKKLRLYIIKETRRIYYRARRTLQGYLF